MQTGGRSPEQPAHASRGHWAKPFAVGAKGKGLNSEEGFLARSTRALPRSRSAQGLEGHSPEQPNLSVISAWCGREKQQEGNTTAKGWQGKNERLLRG